MNERAPRAAIGAALGDNSQYALLQVMGCLADRKCIQGQRISGILVKRNFSYHILAPSDLSSQSLIMNGP